VKNIEEEIRNIGNPCKGTRTTKRERAMKWVWVVMARCGTRTTTKNRLRVRQTAQEAVEEQRRRRRFWKLNWGTTRRQTSAKAAMGWMRRSEKMERLILVQIDRRKMRMKTRKRQKHWGTDLEAAAAKRADRPVLFVGHELQEEAASTVGAFAAVPVVAADVLLPSSFPLVAPPVALSPSAALPAEAFHTAAVESAALSHAEAVGSNSTVRHFRHLYHLFVLSTPSGSAAFCALPQDTVSPAHA
jgi:hypothetical protein